ncbi:hypothetical protein CMI37_30720 [Candidatus Pacearchaeota archaeon]|nr:hypothetical protein [Candidatus Pacearchaeota archaeon]
MEQEQFYQQLIIPDAAETALEAQRASSRRHGILAFDCFNAVVLGRRVYCPVAEARHGGFQAGAADGSLSDIKVLKGTRFVECQGCDRYDGDDEPELEQNPE